MNVRPLTTALQLKAQEEINEDPARVAAHLQVLRDWLNDQPHLQSVEPSDQWLVAFLRGCKYNLEKSKKKLNSYYNLRTAVPELFTNRDPFDENIQELLKLGVFLPLRGCAQDDSPRTSLVRVGELSKTQYDLVDLMKVSFMITEILLLEDDHLTVAGEEVITDMKNVGFALVSQWTPNLARKIFICAEGALTVRLRSLHITNAPRGLKAAVGVLKMFLSPKLRKRIYVYDENYESMYECIPETILPSELGGVDGNMQELIDYWKAKVESYRDWFLQYEDDLTEETKKPMESFTSSDVEPSFRRLELD